MRLLHAAILTRIASPSGFVTQHIPSWYDIGRSREENFAAGIENALATIHSDITPLLNEIPLLALGDRAGAAAVSVRADLEFIENLEPHDNGVNSEMDWEKDSRWMKFEQLLRNWLLESAAVRYDEGPFLTKLSVFVRLHVHMRKALPEQRMERSFFRFPYVEDVTRFGVGDDPSLFSKIGRGVSLREALRVVDVLAPRAEIVMSYLRGGFRSVPREDAGDEELLGRLESIVSGVLLSSQESQKRLGVTRILCPHLLPLSAFISWYWKRISPNYRRKNSLILSFVKICSPPLPTSRGIFSFFSRGMPFGESPTDYYVLVPNQRSLLVEESRDLFESDHLGSRDDLVVRLSETKDIGHGPLKQWLNVMLEEYIKPGNGLFEYSDGRRQFLKPVQGSSFSQSAMAAAGKLIGLGIRYGLTIGARLAPCVVYALRSPREIIADLEGCVKSEDPDYVENLNKLDQLSAETLLADFDLTPETLPEFKKKQLYEKGIGSVKEAIHSMKKGIDKVLQRGSLEIFTQDAFELMVNGIPHLSAETLLAGITFGYLPAGSQAWDWLRHIIETQDEQFRFALNRFVTGVRQPPLNRNEPWIRAHVIPRSNPSSLPRATTNYNILDIPEYPDLQTFTRKLVQAVSESNEIL